MTRAFSTQPIEPAVLDRIVDLAARAPSAGKSQGWDLVVLEGEVTQRFWDVTLPAERRASFRWPLLLVAPVIVLPLADPGAYTSRYGEPDKARTGLADEARWTAPYWTIDASFMTMTLLLAAEAEGLGALFFGVFDNTAAVLAEFGIPNDRQLLGAIALGWPIPSDPGRSASRRRRTSADMVHRGAW